MTFGALFRTLGWTGMIAGLFAFLVMGALIPCSTSMAADAVAMQDNAHHAVELHHVHDKAQHGDHSSAADPCKDGCCGAGCHVLTGPQVLAATTFVFAPDRFHIVPDRFTTGTPPFSIERPPRA